ncbi:hypothetical protein ACHAXH_001853 [Discostella pseudostelligera]
MLPDAQPKHARAYAIPRIHVATFKKELGHLVKIGVLSHTGASKWGSPTFIIPKKDDRYLLPIIYDILSQCKGYEFFSKLDISMQYYTFEHDEELKVVTNIATPFGKYRYNVLPMKQWRTSSAIYKNPLTILNLGLFSDSLDAHLELLKVVLQLLQDNGLSVNPLKCSWGVKETDWLGYWLTPVGLKPWKKKIVAIPKMDPLKNVKQLCGFIGMVNYYKNMWPHRAHILAPLTAKTGTPK